MIKANELRVGNLLNYDTAENDIVVATIDWQDIQWISQDPKGFNLVHTPIPLTEKRLIELGFEKQMSWTYRIHIEGNNFLVYYLGEKGWSINNKPYSDFKCQYVHQLQNLYFALRGQELEIKGGNNG